MWRLWTTVTAWCGLTELQGLDYPAMGSDPAVATKGAK
jgi:hypothetical protein